MLLFYLPNTFKLLIILLIIKLYALNDIFKYLSAFPHDMTVRLKVKKKKNEIKENLKACLVFSKNR